ncbi:MAG: Glu/Leu/Phe/Val dehydrogenase [Gammaproteobacteria bacterium]|nr:Glu/Leu/Phe/Val dehydrogenase [Gammaproteobacteria bacterium]
MTIFTQKSFNNHEQVVFCQDEHSGLKAIIGVHNTKLGPALGGCRFYPYSDEEMALNDVLRLSRGMTYKASVAGLNLGGGKSVIIGDPKKIGTEQLFRAFGRFVNGLNGRYITAEDVGTSDKNMVWINKETPYVTGLPTYFGGSGDPSPFTAHGVFVGIKSALKKQKGSDSLAGVKVAVQGAAGHVAFNLCRELHEAGAVLYISDINKEGLKRAAEEFNATIVEGDEIYKQDVDVYAPCALGATVNDTTIPMLKCSIIAGAANNQLEDEDKHGDMLRSKGILQAPDYVINAGGLISVDSEITGGGVGHVNAQIEDIYTTLLNIYNMADQEGISTVAAANNIAKKRISDINVINGIYKGEE